MCIILQYILLKANFVKRWASKHATDKSLNKGQVGTSTDVHYSEIVLYWEVSTKNRLF